MLKQLLIAATLVMLCCTANAFAGEDRTDLDNLSLGKCINGDLTEEDLRDRVVLVAVWGIN